MSKAFLHATQSIKSVAQARSIIRQVESKFGQVSDYQFLRCPITHVYNGQAFVEFKNPSSAETAAAAGTQKLENIEYNLIQREVLRPKAPETPEPTPSS
ncbi:hypothetical protein K493DRAFT_313324 [Basidiobolus meristosporus CBS 931.73]|uniref:RRM domain-containing protein n=1 Tax=Basidiobolus meristosporus CBS 931.73 TaxID=1314790 RepID=A0A1Y1YMU3_9FUNG|nr:hypothetical protein K493DRAFT_313324 [Basidiobolus meristosporus CBS 931.73]|eukprot:ORX99173.1 hypothetical protein K493DRAFT_313324 [Basidiobolus meristosporus CBS 931.73]